MCNYLLDTYNHTSHIQKYAHIYMFMAHIYMFMARCCFVSKTHKAVSFNLMLHVTRYVRNVKIVHNSIHEK